MTDFIDILKYELEVADLFRRQNYLTRTHIDIYPYATRKNVSDIDVFGVRFDGQLMVNRVISEVKETSCAATDILKLYGFAAYLGRSDSYFVTGSTSKHCRRIASELGIHIATLSKLKQISGTAPKGFIKSNPTAFAKTFDYLDQIKDENNEIYWRYYDLWLEKNPYLRLFHQQDIFETVKVYLDSKSLGDAVRWLRKEIFILSQISIYEIASDCLGIPTNQLRSYMEDRFFDLGTPRKSKERVKSGVESLTKIIHELSDGKIIPPSIEILPNYLPILTRLVEIVLSSTRFAQQYLLRNNDVYLLELEGKSIDLSKVVTPLQHKYMTKFNELLAKVLHNGPITSDFKNFV